MSDDKDMGTNQGGYDEDVPPPPGDEGSGPPPVLTDTWRTVGEWSDKDNANWLRTKPPDRRFLLSVQDDQEGGKPQGVLPLGRVGMLAAGGGVGKSWALIQLALSVATGKDWLGTFEVNEPGAVLLALGEEEAQEVWRRLYWTAKALDLSDDDCALAAEHIVVLPLCGKHVALTLSPAELRGTNVGPSTVKTIETVFARELRERLNNAGVDWRLVVLDPLSRFAGPDVEIDNAAATRVVQCFERLTETRGNPTVLVSHHTNKASRAGTSSAGAARGSSALTDGVRWQANLDAKPNPDGIGVSDLATLHVEKSNYGWFPPELWLHRDRDCSGVFRAASKAERDDYKEACGEAEVVASTEKRRVSSEATARAKAEKDISEAPSADLFE